VTDWEYSSDGNINLIGKSDGQGTPGQMRVILTYLDVAKSGDERCVVANRAMKLQVRSEEGFHLVAARPSDSEQRLRFS
jgi:hypothetical protein